MRTGSVTFWAWTVSVGVHLAILTALGFAKFPWSKPESRQQPIPITRVSRVKELMQAAKIIPKPKMSKPDVKRFDGTSEAKSSLVCVFDGIKPNPESLGDLIRTQGPQSVFSLASGRVLPQRIEFFGSSAGGRKVCYVVDCSGSMQGVFGRVRKELKDSIRKLQQDQYFDIIFFGGDKLLEFGGGRVLRATDGSKFAAYGFIDSVRPSGQTNAMAALERAVQIHDAGGLGPSVVYFLTDGFELTEQDTQETSEKITNLLKRFASGTRINTIGFWPQSNDRKMLETIARESGGEFVLVTDTSK